MIRPLGQNTAGFEGMALTTEAYRALLKDAARYRLLRERISFGADDYDLWFQWNQSWGPYHEGKTTAEAFDAAIDAALIDRGPSS